MCRTCTRRDVARGLLLLEDLGTTPYLAATQAGDDADALYADALAVLADIQVEGHGRRAAARALRPRGARARDGADAGVVLSAPSGI